jgi:hypothetical protein
MNKLLLLGIATLALLANAATSFAACLAPIAPAWTSPGSAGATIDPAGMPGNALNKYAISPFPLNSCLTFKPGATGTIIARYDVVNTAVPSTPMPPWNTFEMGYTMPAGSAVVATLYRVFPCTGQVEVICQINGVAGHTCDCCFFNAGAFNYLTNLYMVQVTLTRPTSDVMAPTVCTLRVYN